MSITRDQKRRCLERELRMRKRVYPSLIGRGKMTQQEADREISIMTAILADYPEAQADMFEETPRPSPFENNPFWPEGRG